MNQKSIGVVGKIVLLGTREYNWLLNPFAYLFRKYWGENNVIYITDKIISDLPDNFYCQQVPAYTQGIWDWHKWFSNGLASIFEYYENELLIIFLLDHWLNQSVNLYQVESLCEYMQENENIIRGNLTVGTCLNNYGQQIDTYKDLHIISLSSNNHHCAFGGGVTFCPSIFNGKNMLKVLGNYWSFHKTEKAGTEKMATIPGLKTIGTKESILHRTHALHHCKPNSISVEGLQQEDIDIIKEMIPDEWKIE